MSTTCTKDIN